MNNRRTTVFINSRNRESGTTNNFRVRLASSYLKNIKSIRVKSVEMPISYYATSSTLLVSWTMQGSGTTYTASIASGTYSATAFASTLQTAMNAQLAGFTLSYSTTTAKITISHALAFRINSATTLTAELGFSGTTSAYATSWTSDNVINVSGTNHIFILSSKLCSERLCIYSDGTTRDIFFKLPVDQGFSQVVSYKTQDNDTDAFFYNNLTLDLIDFRLVDEQFNDISLNGVNWNIELEIITI